MHKITRDMIERGIDSGYIQFIRDPNFEGGTVCAIENYWFYFGGLRAAELNPEEYIAQVPKQEIIDAVYELLEDFKDDPCFENEYCYYYYALEEALVRDDNARDTVAFANKVNG